MIENDGQPFFCHVAPHKNAIVGEENSSIGIKTVLVSSLYVPPKMVALILLTWTMFNIKRIVSFFSQLVLWQSFVVILNLEFTWKKRRRLRFMGQPTFFKIYRRRSIGRKPVTNGFSLREPMHDVRWRKKSYSLSVKLDFLSWAILQAPSYQVTIAAVDIGLVNGYYLPRGKT